MLGEGKTSSMSVNWETAIGGHEPPPNCGTFSEDVFPGMSFPGTFFPPYFIEDVFTYPLFHAWTFLPGVEDVFSGDVFSA